ncbi:hypothetical protein BDW69DRAFT_180356 [Aspergillus filifer]
MRGSENQSTPGVYILSSGTFTSPRSPTPATKPDTQIAGCIHLSPMPPVTSQEYVDEIQFHSRDSNPSTPLSKCLPGFAGWTGQEHYPPDTEKPEQFMAKSGQPHDLVVIHSSGENGWDVQKFGQGEVASFTSDVRAGLDENPGLKQVILARGFMSPAWVAAIGSKFDVDPEFFRRHLDFLPGESFDADSLITSPPKCDMYRLCLSSIYETGDPNDDRDDTDADITAQRGNQIAELRAYKERLGLTDVWCGASIVRDYSILCPRYSVMEQYVSIYVKQLENDDGWTAIIWTDQGLPLTKSPSGPWPAAAHPTRHPPPVMEWTASCPYSFPQATGIGALKACTPFFEQAAFSSKQLQRTLDYRILDAKSRISRASSTASALKAAQSPLAWIPSSTSWAFNAVTTAPSDTRNQTSAEIPDTIKTLLSQYDDLEDSCEDLKATCCNAIDFAAGARINAEQREGSARCTSGF